MVDLVGIIILSLGGMALAFIVGVLSTSEVGAFFATLVFAAFLEVLIIASSRKGAALQLARLRKRQIARSVDQLFLAAGRTLGLAIEVAEPAGGRRLRGRHDGADVVIACVPGNDDVGIWTTSLSVETHHPRLAEIELRSRWKAATTVAAGDATARAMSLAETGSAEFDRLVEVRGRASTALALLTAPVRSALAGLGRRGVVTLARGRLTFETTDHPTSPQELHTLVDTTIAACKTAAGAIVDDVSVALAETARRDPEPGVRAQALRTLVAELGDQPATKPALEHALSDPSDAVRVVAAGALGEPGLPVLQAIARSEGSEEEAAARAIKILGRRLATQDLVAVLDSALRLDRTTVAEAAIETLGRPGDTPACVRLGKVLREADGPLAAAAATALARSNLAEAERPLIDALGSAWSGVRRAAALALGDVGGSDALVALHALLVQDHALTDVETRRAAQHGIGRIRQRIPDLAAGHVSLTTAQGGDLSVSDAPGQGRVSLPERG